MSRDSLAEKYSINLGYAPGKHIFFQQSYIDGMPDSPAMRRMERKIVPVPSRTARDAMRWYKRAPVDVVTTLASDFYWDTDVYVDRSVYLEGIDRSRRRGFAEEHAGERFPPSLAVVGTGLYANRRYRRGDLIMPYKGVRMTPQESDRLARTEGPGRTSYMFEIVNPLKSGNSLPTVVEDSFDPRTSNAARFINAAVHEEDQNVDFVQVVGIIFVRAVRDIEPNEELIGHYGRHTQAIIS